MNLQNFFNPKSVAVIGATNDKRKVGFALISNLLKSGGRKIWPISISEKEVLGLPTLPSVLDVPAEVDLAVIAVRSDLVPKILLECAEKKIKSAIVISAGFKELGSAGRELEEKVAEIADQNSIALLGPNCLGVIDTESDFNSTFATGSPLPGNTAFLSQSGALGTALLDMAVSAGIGFSKFVSLGNEASLSEIDFLEFLADDPETKSILIYLENISDGRRFMEMASEITKTKPIVVLKAGTSRRGVSAIASHTGSLAPDSAVFSAACRQAGVITVNTIREFFSMAKLFQMGLYKPLQKVCILTNGGGPSVVATDLVDNSRSLSLSDISEETKEKLRKVLPPMAAFGNPIDAIGDALSDRFEKALQILLEEKNIDLILLLLTPQMMTEVQKTAELVIKYFSTKPIIPVFLGGSQINPALEVFRKNNIVNFDFPADLVSALDSLSVGLKKVTATENSRTVWQGDSSMSAKTTSAPGVPVPMLQFSLSRSSGAVPSVPSATESSLTVWKNGVPKAKTTSAPERLMPFEQMSALLTEYDIPLSGVLVKEKFELVAVLKKLRLENFAMKAISPDIVHKTDSGAVVLNLKDATEAEKAWDEICRKNPKANIEGMLIQPMVTTTDFNGESEKEVIIGMKRDAIFGPTILFGLGGIFTEAIGDSSLRIAPVTKDQALQMMQEIRGIKILQGLRGEPSVDFPALADILVNISRLASDHPEIKEIDLNPVIATSKHAVLVDARIML